MRGELHAGGGTGRGGTGGRSDLHQLSLVAISDGEIFRAQEYRLYDNTDGDLDIYVETTRWMGLTIRAGVDGVFNNGDDRMRVFYDGSRAAGVVDAIEYRNISNGQIAYLRFQDTF